MPVAGPQPGGRPGGQRRPLDRRRRPGRATSPTTPTRRPSCASAGSARCRACRWSSSSRRTARWSGRCVAYLDVLDLAWPPDKPAPITFVVIPEYVARSWWERILYNQSAQAAADGAARPAAHGRRQRPVPARRPDPVRDGRRRDRRLDGRHVGDVRRSRRQPEPARPGGRSREEPAPAAEPGAAGVGPPTPS